jgi:hypothetical protein
MKGLLDYLLDGDQRPLPDCQEADAGLLARIQRPQPQGHSQQGLLSRFWSPIKQGEQADE